MGVTGPRCAVAKRCGDEPVTCNDLRATVATPTRGVRLEDRECFTHGDVMPRRTASRISGVSSSWRIDADLGTLNVASDAATVGVDRDTVILTFVPG